MSEKSHVSLEQRLCVVCGRTFDTGAVLLDRRLRSSMERHTITGWDLCPEHLQLHAEGFVALVECDPQRSGNPGIGEKITPDRAWRTGRLAHVKREVFAAIFDVTVDPTMPCVFVEPGVIESLQKMQSPSE